MFFLNNGVVQQLPMLSEVITAKRIITNILNMYNLKAIDDEIMLKNELAEEILKDLKCAGYLK